MQGYLFKLPLGFVELFPELAEAPRFGAGGPVGTGPYVESPAAAFASPRERPAFVPRREDVRSRAAQPWSRDPSEVDRALSTHARVERLVAEAAAKDGWKARSYGQGDPVFDLLLERQDGSAPAVVVEVKSTTATNEEKQLRLALGQVLRYRHLLDAGAGDVVALIAIERQMEWLQARAEDLGGNLSAAIRQTITDARLLEMARSDYDDLRSDEPGFTFPPHEDGESRALQAILSGFIKSEVDDLELRRPESGEFE